MTTGTANIGIGGGALYQNTGDNNVSIGLNSSYNMTSGNNNVALGYASLNTIITGDYSVAIGYQSLKLATGSQNLAIGYNAGSAVTTGTYNTIIGGNTGASIATSSNNLIIADGQGNAFITGNSSRDLTFGSKIILSRYPGFSNISFDTDYSTRIYDSYNQNIFTTHPADGSGFSNSSSGTATAYLNRSYSEGTNFNTVTSSTYAAGSPTCAFVFKTGVTGKVSVNVGGLIRNDTLGALVGVSYQIYEGTSSSGTLIVDTSDSRAFLNYNSAYVQGSFTSLISLTANTTYYIRTMHRVSSGNGVIASRFLTVTALN